MSILLHNFKLETNAHFPPPTPYIFIIINQDIGAYHDSSSSSSSRVHGWKMGSPSFFLIIYEFWFDNCCVFHITKLGFWNEDILIWFNWVWLFRLKWGVFSLIIFEIMVMVMVWDWVLFCFVFACFVLFLLV